jgi:hypothetical protein
MPLLPADGRARWGRRHRLPQAQASRASPYATGEVDGGKARSAEQRGMWLDAAAERKAGGRRGAAAIFLRNCSA